METQPTLTDEERTALLKGVPSLPATTQEDRDHYTKLIKALNSPIDEAKKILSTETAPFLGEQWAGILGQFGKGLFDLAVGTQIALLFQQALDYVHATIDAMNKNADDLIRAMPLRTEVIKSALPKEIIRKLKEKLIKTPLFEEADDLHIEILAATSPLMKSHLLGQIKSLKQAAPLLNQEAGGVLPITPLFLAEFMRNTDAKEALQSKGATKKQSPLLDLLLESSKQTPQPQDKWRPSSNYRALMQKNPDTYKTEIKLFQKFAQNDPDYAKKLSAEDPRFFDWLMKQQY